MKAKNMNLRDTTMAKKRSNIYTNSNFDFLIACHEIKFDEL